MLTVPAGPAEFGDPGFGCRGLCGCTECRVDGELEVQLFAAAIAVDLPVMDCQLAKYRPAGHGHPLPGRVDQVTDLFNGQPLGKVAAAFECYQQGVAAANRTAITGDLIAARRQCAAFGERVGGVEQGVAEIVFCSHDALNSLASRAFD